MIERLRTATAVAVTVAMLSLGNVQPARADGAASTRNIILGGAALAAALIIGSNVAHKAAKAHTVVGYTADGGTVYGDGRIVYPNGYSYYPGDAHQGIACNNGSCYVYNEGTAGPAAAYPAAAYPPYTAYPPAYAAGYSSGYAYGYPYYGSYPSYSYNYQQYAYPGYYGYGYPGYTVNVTQNGPSGYSTAAYPAGGYSTASYPAPRAYTYPVTQPQTAQYPRTGDDYARGYYDGYTHGYYDGWYRQGANYGQYGPPPNAQGPVPVQMPPPPQ